jgi:hypothetical protein
MPTIMDPSVMKPKKALLIMPSWIYATYITKALEQKGYSVDYFSDRPSESFYSKTLIRIWKPLDFYQILPYQNRILKRASEVKYDFILVINGESFSPDFFQQLAGRQKKAKKIYFIWDTLAFYQKRIKNTPYFDFVFSFEKKDCEKYGFYFLSDFYTDCFKPESLPIEYDYSFISTAKPGKIGDYLCIKSELENRGFTKGYTHLYIQGKLIYQYFALKNSDFRQIGFKNMSTEKISYEDYATITKKSRYVIDCVTKGQTGLTMKVFEALAAKKKIITNNSSVADYDFYDPRNIWIFGSNSNEEFWKPGFFSEITSEEAIKHYSLDAWIDKLISFERSGTPKS